MPHLEVVRGIEDGLSYQLIADRHFISLYTVRSHIRNVYRKLQVNFRHELLAHVHRRQCRWHTTKNHTFMR